MSAGASRVIVDGRAGLVDGVGIARMRSRFPTDIADLWKRSPTQRD